MRAIRPRFWPDFSISGIVNPGIPPCRVEPVEQGRNARLALEFFSNSRRRGLDMRYGCAGLILLALALPGWSQTPAPTEPARSPGDADVEFIDSQEAYWVNKGFNDVLFYGAQGSINAARNERDQHRSEELMRKLYRGPQVVGAQVGGKKNASSVLKINGKEVKVSP